MTYQEAVKILVDNPPEKLFSGEMSKEKRREVRRAIVRVLLRLVAGELNEKKGGNGEGLEDIEQGAEHGQGGKTCSGPYSPLP